MTYRILVVCGAGGVGKTSVSAALAVRGANDRRSIVCTIDPARRLATALGLDGQITHEERSLHLSNGSEMWAAMLDMKTAWDALIERYSPDPATAKRIKANRLFGGLSQHFIGSQGYMAMERLADLHESARFDLIVIDTPPTRNALDFLEAPKRMTDFIGGSLLRWLAKPYTSAGRFGVRAFNLTAGPFLKIADRILGSQLLEDLSEFVVDFQRIYVGFKVRAQAVLDLMKTPEVGFVVVTSSETAAIQEAKYFARRLAGEGLHLAAIVVNRVMPAQFAELTGEAEALSATNTEAATVLKTLATMASRDQLAARELSTEFGVPVISIPLLGRDVCDVKSLEEIASHLPEL